MKRKILGIGVGLALASLAMSESLTTTMTGQVTDLTGLTIAGVYSNITIPTDWLSTGVSGNLTSISASTPVYIYYYPMPAGIASTGQQAMSVAGMGKFDVTGGSGNYVFFRVINPSYSGSPITLNLSWTVTTQGMNGMSLTSNVMGIKNNASQISGPITNPIISADGGSSTSSGTISNFGEYTSLTGAQNDISADRNYIFLNLDLTGTPSNNGRAGVPDSIYIQHVLVLNDV